MEVPIQISGKEEDVSVNLLKRSLESALYRENVDLTIPSEYTGVRGFYEDNIKVNKIAYAAIEEYDLPVIRTWFKYGQWEPYERLRPKSLNISHRSQDAFVPSSQHMAVTEDDLVDFFLDIGLKEIFDQDLFEFLSDNYREWEPDPYTDAYLASTDLIEVLEDAEKLSRTEFINNIDDNYDQFKEASLDLRYHLGKVETIDDDLMSHIKQYLNSVDEMLIQVEETSELDKEQMESIEQSRIVYHNHVLRWIGFHISLEKAAGPETSVKSFKHSGGNILKADKNSWRTQLKGWKADLQEKSLSADYKTVRSSSPTAPDSIRDLQDAAFKNT